VVSGCGGKSKVISFQGPASSSWPLWFFGEFPSRNRHAPSGPVAVGIKMRRRDVPQSKRITCCDLRGNEDTALGVWKC